MIFRGLGFSGRNYLLDRFPNSSAAYSIRRLRRDYRGNCVKVRRSSDNALKDIGFDFRGNLDERALLSFIKAESDTAVADYGDGAEAAYSVRKVSNTYSGNCINVRRSSDNTTLDIGFDADGNLDETALLAFVGTGGTDNGFVTVWYDQSGSGNDASQNTQASQPKIVNAGTVVKENGLPAMEFDGVNDHFAASTAYDTQSTETHFYVASSTGSNERVIDTRGTGAAGAVIGWHHKFNHVSDISIIDDGTAYIQIQGIIRSGQKLVSAELSLTQLKEYTNSVLEDTQTGSLTSFDSGNPLYIGANVNGADTQLFDGKMQEIVLYNSDQSSNRTTIEANINSYYNIYTPSNDGFVHTWYDQSGEGNHATQDTADSQPKIVSSGTVVKENGLPTLDFDGSTQVLQNSVGATDLSNVSMFVTAGISQLNDDATIVAYPDIGNNAGVSLGQGGLGTAAQIGLRYRISGVDIDTDGIALTTGQKLFSALCTASTIAELFENGTAGALNVSARLNFDNFEIGASGNSVFHFDGTIQEVVIFESDQSANRTGIEANINAYFSIYL